MDKQNSHAAISSDAHSTQDVSESSPEIAGSELSSRPCSDRAPMDTLSNSMSTPLSNSVSESMSTPSVHLQIAAPSLSTWTVQMDIPNGQGTWTSPQEPATLVLGDYPTLRTKQQEKVLCFFRDCRHCLTSYNALGRTLNIPYGSVRHIIRRLTKLGHLRAKPYSENGMQGIEVWCCGSGFYPAKGEVEPDTSLHSRTEQMDRVSGHPVEHPYGQPLHIEERKIEKENQSIWNLSVEQIGELWPYARKAGLFAGHLRQARDALHLQDFHEKEEAIVAQTLRFLDWQIEQGGITDKEGKPVTNPIAYWLRSLQRHGYYAKPAGYVDPQLLALKQLEEEESARIAAENKLLAAREEQERTAMETEINAVLQALAEEGERHPLWEKLLPAYTGYTRDMIRKDGSAALLNPMMAGITRLELRKIYGIPAPNPPSPS